MSSFPFSEWNHSLPALPSAPISGSSPETPPPRASTATNNNDQSSFSQNLTPASTTPDNRPMHAVAAWMNLNKKKSEDKARNKRLNEKNVKEEVERRSLQAEIKPGCKRSTRFSRTNSVENTVVQG
jgi:hypothetical protein